MGWESGLEMVGVFNGWGMVVWIDVVIECGWEWGIDEVDGWGDR